MAHSSQKLDSTPVRVIYKFNVQVQHEISSQHLLSPLSEFVSFILFLNVLFKQKKKKKKIINSLSAIDGISSNPTLLLPASRKLWDQQNSLVFRLFNFKSLRVVDNWGWRDENIFG